MTESIPVNLLEKWISDLQSGLEQECQEANSGRDFSIKQGMREGLGVIQHKIATWLTHQDHMQTLNRSEQRLLITKDVNLSHGNFRKLEWYEDDHFFTLAWRHGMHEVVGELMLEIQKVHDLSKIFLVYQGGLSFDDLAGLARKGGLDSIRNQENRQEWVEKSWH